MWMKLFRLSFGALGFGVVLYMTDKPPMAVFASVAIVCTLLRIYFVFNKDEVDFSFLTKIRGVSK